MKQKWAESKRKKWMIEKNREKWEEKKMGREHNSDNEMRDRI